MAYRTVPEVAKRLRISERHTYTLINNGELPHRRLGKRIIIADRVLDDYLERTHTGGDQPPKDAA